VLWTRDLCTAEGYFICYVSLVGGVGGEYAVTTLLDRVDKVEICGEVFGGTGEILGGAGGTKETDKH
jgi:hypothetical protein